MLEYKIMNVKESKSIVIPESISVRRIFKYDEDNILFSDNDNKVYILNKLNGTYKFILKSVGLICFIKVINEYLILCIKFEGIYFYNINEDFKFIKKYTDLSYFQLDHIEFINYKNLLIAQVNSELVIIDMITDIIYKNIFKNLIKNLFGAYFIYKDKLFLQNYKEFISYDPNKSFKKIKSYPIIITNKRVKGFYDFLVFKNYLMVMYNEFCIYNIDKKFELKTYIYNTRLNIIPSNRKFLDDNYIYSNNGNKINIYHYSIFDFIED